jgi:hypothetical protein
MAGGGVCDRSIRCWVSISAVLTESIWSSLACVCFSDRRLASFEPRCTSYDLGVMKQNYDSTYVFSVCKFIYFSRLIAIRLRCTCAIGCVTIRLKFVRACMFSVCCMPFVWDHLLYITFFVFCTEHSSQLHCKIRNPCTTRCIITNPPM